MHRKSLMVASRAGLSLLCALCAIESLHAVAYAQWLPDRAYTVGPGIRVGDLELHPGVAARGGYDSNIFRSEKGREVDGATIAVTPHLNISTLTQQRLTQGEDASGATTTPISRPLAFNLGFSTTFFHMFVANTPTNVEFDTDASLALKPDGPVGFDFGGAYQRTIRPFTEYTGSSANNEYARNHVAPLARFRAQSRSGVLKVDLSYVPDVLIYESPTFEYLNNVSHGVRVGASWRFLPFTAMISDVTLSYSNYLDPTTAHSEVLVSDSKRFTGRIGLNGNITRTMSLRLLAGYAVENFDDSALDDYEDVVGEAMIGWAFGANKLEAGYQRAVLPSPVGGWTRTDRGMFKASFLLARVFALGFEAGAGKAHYGRIVGPRPAPNAPAPLLGIDSDTGAPTDERDDVRVDGAVHAEYRATNWLAFMADFAAFATLTDYEYLGLVNAPPDPAKFVVYQVFGGVRFHY